jgi:hypothetical protein
MDDTPYHQLEKDLGSSKTVFIGHRRRLRKDDPWRKLKDLSNGKIELRGQPCLRSSDEIDELLTNWPECPGPGKKRKAPKPLLKVWKTRSVFWNLPYEDPPHPHSLDVMHITKNMCESLLGTLLNMPNRTKDGPKARHDLEFIRIRDDLHVGCTDDDDDDETEGRRKGKKAKRNNYHCHASCFALSP